MTSSTPKKLPKILPKWAIWAFLIGGLGAFVAAVMLFTDNVVLALPFFLLTAVTYLVGIVGYVLAPRGPSRAQPLAPHGTLPTRSPILTARSLIAFAVVTCVAVFAWKALAPDPAPAPTLEQATIPDDVALDRADSDFERGEYQSALVLLEPVAAKGNCHAQTMLAQIYFGQTGVPRDEVRAAQWAQKSVDQNCAEGLIFMSNMYVEGNGVPQDPARGLALIQRAVALDSAQAKAQLGVMFLKGVGVDKDPVQARQWIMASAKQGFFGAQVILGRLVLHEGTRLGVNLPPIGSEPGADAALPPVSAAVKKAAEAGDAEAQLVVGRSLYTQALAVGGDVIEAQPWVEKSAASGNVMAQFAAGALYIDGAHGVPYSGSEARTWFEKGVAQLP